MRDRILSVAGAFLAIAGVALASEPETKPQAEETPAVEASVDKPAGETGASVAPEAAEKPVVEKPEAEGADEA